jgi:hypothetical protein
MKQSTIDNLYTLLSQQNHGTVAEDISDSLFLDLKETI